jgi:hypothetical protein
MMLIDFLVVSISTDSFIQEVGLLQG